MSSENSTLSAIDIMSPAIKELPSRDAIEEKYKWNLDDIYASREIWEEDFKWIEDNLNEYDGFKGHLSKSSKIFLGLLKFDDEIGMKLSRLYLYAMLSKDSDLLDQDSKVLHERISTLHANVSTASAFIRPEILSFPSDRLQLYYDENPELKLYKHKMDNLLREKQHTRSGEVEEVLALSGEINRVPYNAFTILADAEMQFPVVTDTDGNEIKISHGRYNAALYSNDRTYRKNVYRAFYKPFIEYKNTIAVLFSGVMKTHTANARIRKFNSCRHAALNTDNIPEAVYDNLIKNVNENLNPLHRWMKIKKDVLGFDELHPYDLYVTLFPSSSRKYRFEEARELTVSALRPLGTEYIASLQKAFDSRWIDVYETKNKRSGAYSSGPTFGVHPYVLLNWNGQLNDVFTLAHEMGHNMHSYYTVLFQPYPYSEYSIFLAEVASTTNEALLLDYMIENAETKQLKMLLIEKYLTNITTTFYRQTAFAEFELGVHELAENSVPLVPDTLCSLYKKIAGNHWGPAVTVDAEESFTWARVPHFYYNFYVFQYATGYSASQAIVDRIKNEGQPAVDKYLDFLKAGSSAYPLDVLSKAGVDMKSPETVLLTIKKMNDLLNLLEDLL